MIFGEILNKAKGVIGTSDREKRKLSLSIFIALLVHVAGGIGIAFFKRDFFLSLTSVNLILMFLLLLWNAGSFENGLFLFLGISFFIGVISEIIGVNTGWLFGEYAYGSLLGPKILGVPLLIGINWFCIVYCSLQLTRIYLPSLNKIPVAGSLIAALLATIFDWIMEPVAMELGYWQWENDLVPAYNYACWLLISFIIAGIYFWFGKFRRNTFAIPLLLIQFLFFLFLRMVIT